MIKGYSDGVTVASIPSLLLAFFSALLSMWLPFSPEAAGAENITSKLEEEESKCLLAE